MYVNATMRNTATDGAPEIRHQTIGDDGEVDDVTIDARDGSGKVIVEVRLPSGRDVVMGITKDDDDGAVVSAAYEEDDDGRQRLIEHSVIGFSSDDEDDGGEQ